MPHIPSESHLAERHLFVPFPDHPPPHIAIIATELSVPAVPSVDPDESFCLGISSVRGQVQLPDIDYRAPAHAVDEEGPASPPPEPSDAGQGETSSAEPAENVSEPAAGDDVHLDPPPNEPPTPGAPPPDGPDDDGPDFDKQLRRLEIDEAVRARVEALLVSPTHGSHELVEFVLDRAQEFTTPLIEDLGPQPKEIISEEGVEPLKMALAELGAAFTDPSNYQDTFLKYDTVSGLLAEVKAELAERGEEPGVAVVAARFHDLSSRLALVRESMVEAGAISPDTPYRHQVYLVKGFLDRSLEYPDAFVPFEPYRELMNDIDTRIADGEEPSAIEGHLASNGICFVFETPDGNVIKLPRQAFLEDDRRLLENVRYGFIAPRELGRGVPGLEQMISYTVDDGGAIVCEKAPGSPIQQLSPEEIDAIPPGHFKALMQLAKKISWRGLDPSFTEYNVLHDRREGFTLVDYGIVEGERLSPEEVARFSWSGIMPDGVFDPQGQLRPAAVRFLDAYRATFGEAHANALEQEWGNLRPDDDRRAREILAVNVGRFLHMVSEDNPTGNGAFDRGLIETAHGETLQASGLALSQELRIPKVVIKDGLDLYTALQTMPQDEAFRQMLGSHLTELFRQFVYDVEDYGLNRLEHRGRIMQILREDMPVLAAGDLIPELAYSAREFLKYGPPLAHRLEAAGGEPQLANHMRQLTQFASEGDLLPWAIASRFGLLPETAAAHNQADFPPEWQAWDTARQWQPVFRLLEAANPAGQFRPYLQQCITDTLDAETSRLRDRVRDLTESEIVHPDYPEWLSNARLRLEALRQVQQRLKLT